MKYDHYDEIPINNSIKGNDLYSRDQDILPGGVRWASEERKPKDSSDGLLKNGKRRIFKIRSGGFLSFQGTEKTKDLVSGFLEKVEPRFVLGSLEKVEPRFV
ncbi:unnamed protein product [Rhizophagus irregularis]|nr:unnamed protein product [Rhizophagus irregularis]